MELQSAAVIAIRSVGNHECPYSDKDDVDDCMDYFMGECQNTCTFCPMEDKYGVIW